MKTSAKYAVWTFLSVLTFFIGGLLNDIVLFFNDGMMPVFLGRFWNEPSILDADHVAMTASSHLKILCDVLPVGNVIASFGDVLLMTGFVSLCTCISATLFSLIKQRKKI